MTKKILFVCTANVFRSLSAEFFFNYYTKKHEVDSFLADSAGTFEKTADLDPRVTEIIQSYGVDASKHEPKELSKSLIEDSDVVIAMAKSHQKFIKKKFGVSVPLYNEIAFGQKKSVDDVEDVMLEEECTTEAVIDFMKNTISYINDSTPELVKQIRAYK